MPSIEQMVRSDSYQSRIASDVSAYVAALASERTIGAERDVDDADRPGSWAWAQNHFKEHIRRLIEARRARRVMEIGGGRWPMFSADEIAALGVRYVVNDISDRELAIAPRYADKACFDIAEPDEARINPYREQHNVIFSKMVFEHVRDTRKAYRNIQRLLAAGGACLNFHPVLFCPPFVINALLPERLSRRVLKFFVPIRTNDGIPKFPAWYDRCRVSPRIREEIRAIGFRRVWQIPFYYHGYFRKIPGLYQLDRALSRCAERRDWQALASYCYTVAVK